MSDVWSSGSAGASGASPTLEISLEPPRQRRWTVAIRWILAVPLGVAAIGVVLAGIVWVIGAWFSALATGRVSDALHARLLGVVQFQARLTAYSDLLTDQWPGVHFQPRADDPVVVSLDHVELRRSAVLFRLFLALPALVLSNVVGAGVYPLLLSLIHI